MLEHFESINANLSPEQRFLHNVVQLFQSARYKYATISTHEDKEGLLHFFKPVVDKSFPRLHLTFHPTQKTINIHLDVRMHVSTDISNEVSKGIKDLQKFLTDEFKPADPTMGELKEVLSKQCLELALFNSSSKLSILQEAGKYTVDHKRKVIKRAKLKKTGKQMYNAKRYNQTREAEE